MQKFIIRFQCIYSQLQESLIIKKGDFPNAEKIANSTISLPVHEFITKKNMNKMINLIKSFYNES